MEAATPTADISKLRAFRSVWVWFALSVILLGAQYHRRHTSQASISFTIQIDGAEPRRPYEVTLDGAAFSSGEKTGVGWKRFKVTSAGTEPFATNLFVWYTGKTLGVISLARIRRDTIPAKANERRVPPNQVLEGIASGYPYNDLFQVQTMRFDGSVKVVRAGIKRALEQAPSWTFQRHDKPDTETGVTIAELKDLTTRRKVVLVVGQTTTSEVTIYFKLFDFVAGNNVEPNAREIPDHAYKPLHPQYVSNMPAQMLLEQVATDIQDFKNRIRSEMRQLSDQK